MHAKFAAKSVVGDRAARTSAESSLASARRRLQRVDGYVAANRALLAKLKRS